MNDKQLEQFKKWFYDYVATFYIGDTLYDDNIKLKECHTRRVCADILILADRLGFDGQQKIIAETTGLFHDVGRFEQYKRFHSYNDVGTINHSLLGLEILAENKILDCLSADEKEIIETSVRFHGGKELPKNLAPQIEPFAKLIRDADKLDIYYVMVERLDDFKKNPEKYMTTLGYQAKEGCSPHVIRTVLEGRTIDYKEFQSINDMIVGIIGWVSDVNFAPVLEEIKNRGYLEKLVKFLPDTEDIRKVARHAENLIAERIAAS